MKTPSLLIALLVVSQAVFARPAPAMPPLGRNIIGTIQKVDAQSHEVEMLREDKGTVITFVRIRRTTFVDGGRFTGPAILKKGARVKVRYHIPIFGSPFVTQVTLLPTATQTN